MKGFPFYKQRDQMDCGPTCLQMIAKFYGKTIPVNELRNKMFLTQQGTSLLSIGETAESIGLRSLGIKLTLKKLMSEARLPCIVHWNQEHFAIVYRVSKNKIFVADPSVGLLSYKTEEFSQSWESSFVNGQRVGVALLLEPSTSFDQIDSESKNTLNGF